jgi:hypothetical protein
MDANMEEWNNGSLRRWNWVLSVLAWLGIAWTVYLVVVLFFGSDFTLAVKTSEGLKILTASDVTPVQRFVLSVALLPPVLCWIYCLFQVVRLSSYFAKSEILSTGVVRCLESFGFGLAAQGVGESVQLPIVATYLIGQGKIDSVEGVWENVVGSGVLTSMMAAVLIIVICRILRIGIQLREDAELTI